MRERERLIARIRQVRRVAAPPATAPASPPDDPAPDALRSLEARVVHLEQMVQGLQDSVHRESSRQSKRITDVESAIEPATLSRALSQDARERGL